jgi:hypothetical protein
MDLIPSVAERAIAVLAKSKANMTTREIAEAANTTTQSVTAALKPYVESGSVVACWSEVNGDRRRLFRIGGVIPELAPLRGRPKKTPEHVVAEPSEAFVRACNIAKSDHEAVFPLLDLAAAAREKFDADAAHNSQKVFGVTSAMLGADVEYSAPHNRITSPPNAEPDGWDVEKFISEVNELDAVTDALPQADVALLEAGNSGASQPETGERDELDELPASKIGAQELAELHTHASRGWRYADELEQERNRLQDKIDRVFPLVKDLLRALGMDGGLE